MPQMTPYYELDKDDPFYAPYDPSGTARLCAYKMSINSKPKPVGKTHMKNKPSPLMDKDRAIELLNKYGFRGPKEVKIAVATYLLEKLIDGKDS